jgi:hypothetical protein
MWVFMPDLTLDLRDIFIYCREMESSEQCFARAQADRDAAATSTLPREREVLERSAEHWQQMGEKAVEVERHRLLEEHRRAADKLAKLAEEEPAEPKPVEPMPPATDFRSVRDRLRWVMDAMGAAG